MSVTEVSTISADGVEVFYRHQGDPSAPVILLLHGFPASSFMFRNLIPLLATKYRVVAPDIPGFGFTKVPESRGYKYTFASFARTIGAFLDALKIKRFAVYIFDYGAPTGLRLALERPSDVAAIVTQSGNAYEEGLGDFWNIFRTYWASDTLENRDAMRIALTPDFTRWQYENGSPHPQKIQPETYHLDQALMERPGGFEQQLDMFYDYGTNVPLYPKFHEFFRTSGVPILAVWGKHDTIFISPGADAYERDAKIFEKHFLDAGHFALETNEKEMAAYILNFFEKHKVFA